MSNEVKLVNTNILDSEVEKVANAVRSQSFYSSTRGGGYKLNFPSTNKESVISVDEAILDNIVSAKIKHYYTIPITEVSEDDARLSDPYYYLPLDGVVVRGELSVEYQESIHGDLVTCKIVYDGSSSIVSSSNTESYVYGTSMKYDLSIDLRIDTTIQPSYIIVRAYRQDYSYHAGGDYWEPAGGAYELPLSEVDVYGYLVILPRIPSIGLNMYVDSVSGGGIISEWKGIGECHDERIVLPQYDLITDVGISSINLDYASDDSEEIISRSRVKSLIIPNTVTHINTDHFEDFTDLEKIEVAQSNKNYCSIDGILYSKDKTELIWSPPAKTSST